MYVQSFRERFRVGLTKRVRDRLIGTTRNGLCAPYWATKTLLRRGTELDSDVMRNLHFRVVLTWISCRIETGALFPRVIVASRALPRPKLRGHEKLSIGYQLRYADGAGPEHLG